MDLTTIKQATEKWVSQFNALPLWLIEKAYLNNGDHCLYEQTRNVVIKGDKIYYQGESYEALEVDSENDKVLIELENEREQLIETYVDIDQVEVIDNSSFLPAWGTMWSFQDSSDSEWAMGNLDIMKACGFKVYEDENEGEVYIGIDGCGYDFYAEHWIPLYRARGLQWHNIETREELNTLEGIKIACNQLEYESYNNNYILNQIKENLNEIERKEFNGNTFSQHLQTIKKDIEKDNIRIKCRTYMIYGQLKISEGITIECDSTVYMEQERNTFKVRYKNRVVNGIPAKYKQEQEILLNEINKHKILNPTAEIRQRFNLI